jgi:hypothetical protein
METHTQLNQLLNQIRNPDKRNWILLVPSSLGETLAVCGLAKSFVEKHGYGITLVISESHRFIADCYAGTFDRVVFMDMGSMRLFSESGFIPNNFFQLDFPYNTFPAQNGDGRLGTIYDLWTTSRGRRGLSFLDKYRYILRLDWNAKFNLPDLPKEAVSRADELIKKFRIPKDKSVILLVGNNTAKPAPASLWEKIARRYHENGYDVIINTHGSMFVPQPLNIPFAKRIDLTVDVLVPLCIHSGNLVSASNGGVFCTLGFATDCKINVLLPNEVCVDWQKLIFAKIDNAAGCHQLSCPELADLNENLFEWNVPDGSDAESSFADLANDITSSNKASRFLISNDLS